MLAREYLTLAKVRLRDGETWSPPGSCLNFVFPTSGSGELGPARSAPGNGAAESSRPGGLDSELKGLVLSPGDVLVLDGPSQGVVSNRSHRDRFTFSTFSLCIEHLFPLFAGRDIALLETVRESLKTARLFSAGLPVAIRCHELLKDVPPPFDIDHRSQLLQTAATIIALEFKNARITHRSRWNVEEHMSQVLESLSTSDIMEGSVEDLARKFGCTTRHLNRLFNQHFGCSVATLRMEMRLLRAASLLCDPAAKVIQVASECGFNYLGQFNTCFKRRFGKSPSQWRQAYKESGSDGTPLLEDNSTCRVRNLGLCPWKNASEKSNGNGSAEGMEAGGIPSSVTAGS